MNNVSARDQQGAVEIIPLASPAHATPTFGGMKLQQAALCVVSIALSCASCRKNKDDTPPAVRIVLPVAGSTFAVPDTIAVRVEVADDRQVTGLTVDLLNASNGMVVSGGTRTTTGTGGTYEFNLILTDERLPTGRYTIVARASDGSNDGRGFREVNILEAPLRLRSLFLAPPFGTESTTITRIDSLGQPSTFATVADFNGIAVDNYTQHLFVAGSQHAPFHAFPTSSSANTWQVPATWNDHPEQFTAVTVDPKDRRVYFATRDGFIRGFTGTGAQQFTARCLPDHRCEAIVVMQSEVATWQRAIVGGASRIVTYTVAGTVFEQLPVQHERIALFHLTGTSLVHFANDDGTGLIEDLNISIGGSPDIRSFPGEAIRAAIRLDTNTYIIALTNRLVRFNHPARTTTEITSGLSADALAYDPANGALYIAQGGTMLTMDPNSGAIVGSIATGSPIGHILPLLNR